MITITEKAVAAVKRLSEAEGIGHFTVRVKVKGGGCAGMTQDMYFEDQEFVSEADEITEQDGVRVVIDPLSMQYLDGMTVDFVEGPYSSGFKFENPNVKGSCGCGSSVSF
jgi:iron-sulfur cluster insertion protein